jgi:hypothetical protein
MMEGSGTTESTRHRETHGILCRKDSKAQRNTKREKGISNDGGEREEKLIRERSFEGNLALYSANLCENFRVLCDTNYARKYTV